MLYRHRQGTFEVCPFMATYLVKRDSIVQNGIDEEGNIIYETIKIDLEEVRYVHDKEYFENILNEHEVYSNLVYEDVILTDEQLSRYQEIRSLPESSISHCIDYVSSGVFPDGVNHALRNIQLEKENLNLKLSQAETNNTLLEFMEAILMGGM